MGIYTVQLSDQQGITISFSIPDADDHFPGYLRSTQSATRWAVFDVKVHNAVNNSDAQATYTSLENARRHLYEQTKAHLSEVARFAGMMVVAKLMEEAKGDRADPRELADLHAMAPAVSKKAKTIEALLEVLANPETEITVNIDPAAII